MRAPIRNRPFSRRRFGWATPMVAGVWGLIAGLSAVAEQSETVDSAVVVGFNIGCAHCHEGECSGRMSFSSGAEGAAEHIRRYAGPVTPASTMQYFRLLERMKSDCSVYPLPGLGPESTDPDGIAAFLDPLGKGYFLPLGGLAAGGYELALNFSGPWGGRAEVLSKSFEPILDRCLGPEARSWRLVLEVDHPEPHYLRLRSERSVPSRLLGYALRSAETPDLSGR
jgi:hypothetical protein